MSYLADQVSGPIEPRKYPLALVEAVWGELKKNAEEWNAADEMGSRAAYNALEIFEVGFGLPRTTT